MPTTLNAMWEGEKRRQISRKDFNLLDWFVFSFCGGRRNSRPFEQKESSTILIVEKIKITL